MGRLYGEGTLGRDTLPLIGGEEFAEAILIAERHGIPEVKLVDCIERWLAECGDFLSEQAMQVAELPDLKDA